MLETSRAALGFALPLLRFIVLVTGPLRRVGLQYAMFWVPLHNGGLTAVVSKEDRDHLRHGTQALDFLAVIEWLQKSRELSLTCAVEQAHQVSVEQRRKNLLSIGGPIPNEFTKDLLTPANTEAGYYFDGPDGHTIMLQSDWSFKIPTPPPVSNGLPSFDYGVITVMRNPYNRRKIAIMVCGCFGWGTQAALRTLLEGANLKWLRKQARFYQCICRCAIDASGVAQQPYILDIHPEQALRRPTFRSLEVRHS